MRSTHRAPPAAALLLAASLSLWLAGCGGDDDPATGSAVAPAGASVVAVDDTATVVWNAAGSIDVLANDSASSGTLALSAAAGAAHGSVAIAAGKLSYTPAAGYIGTDSVSYTVRADDGGATATASVAITVQAQMRLSGVVVDGPIAGAAVTVTVGGTDFRTTADANGNYVLDITAADPAAFVTVVATGTGAQAGVKLISLVGDVASLATKADPAGKVASSDVPALNATHLSTAQAVLAARATRDGKLPTTAQGLARASAAVDMSEMLRLATLVRLVADQGVALPAGVSDTLALLQDKTKLDAFVQDQLVNHAAVFAAAQTSVLSDAPIAEPPVFAAGGAQMVVYSGSYEAFVVTYRADGTATVLDSTRGSVPATWHQEASTVTLTFDAPMTSVSYSADLDPVTNEQSQIELSYKGLAFRHVAGDSHAGAATVTEFGTAVYLDGSHQGQAAAEYSAFFGAPRALMTVADIDRRLEIASSEVAVGSRIAGVSQVAASFGIYEDILKITDAAKGTFETTGETVDWSLSDRWLTVTRASGERIRYARLAIDQANGSERWLVVNVSPDGSDGNVWVSLLVVAEPGLRYDATSAARNWRFADFYAQDPANELIFRLYPDGTGSQDGLGSSAFSTPYTWSVDADGRLVIARTQGQQVRTWTLLKARNGQYLVFDSRRNGANASFRYTRWYEDLGPAVKP